ncbi:MAG: hypothetical protein ACM3NN_02665 [Nitrospirota bacterium]
MATLASVLILFLLTPATANAFQFDSWRSGMSVREAMAVAQDKDIPILREGVISMNKHFDASVMNHIATANEFYYRADLLGEPAKVNLTFTPASKFLSTINVHWNAPFKDRAFQTKLFQLLTGKYGNYAKRERQIFFETSTWAIDKTNRVSMRTGGNSILVEYLDTIAYEQAQKEAKKKQDENWRQSKDKDASKF